MYHSIENFILFMKLDLIGPSVLIDIKRHDIPKIVPETHLVLINKTISSCKNKPPHLVNGKIDIRQEILK